jgi:hypothetical protein
MLIVCSLFIIGPQTLYNTLTDLTVTPSGGLSQTSTELSGTQSQTSTQTETPTVTPTTTLMPLPIITLIFPAYTSSPEITQKPTPILPTSTQISDSGNIYHSDFPRVELLIIVLVFIWVILACFLIIYIRQLK